MKNALAPPPPREPTPPPPPPPEEPKLDFEVPDISDIKLDGMFIEHFVLVYLSY